VNGLAVGKYKDASKKLAAKNKKIEKALHSQKKADKKELAKLKLI